MIPFFVPSFFFLSRALDSVFFLPADGFFFSTVVAGVTGYSGLMLCSGMINPWLKTRNLPHLRLRQQLVEINQNK